MYKYCGKSIGPLIFDEGPGHSGRVNSAARSHSAGINGKLLIERHFIQGLGVIQCEGLSGRTESHVFPSCTRRKATVSCAGSLNAEGSNPPKGKTDSIFFSFLIRFSNNKKRGKDKKGGGKGWGWQGEHCPAGVAPLSGKRPNTPGCLSLGSIPGTGWMLRSSAQASPRSICLGPQRREACLGLREVVSSLRGQR